MPAEIAPAEPMATLVRTPSPCGPAGREGEMLCAALRVPLDSRRQGAGELELDVVVLPAIEPSAGAARMSRSPIPAWPRLSSTSAPLFYVVGGPGLAATGFTRFFLEWGSVYRRERDVVLVDQRGSGGAAALRCPGLERRHSLEDAYPEEEVAACRRELEAHTDLGAYSTESAARDLDRVREALGYEQIDLLAVSYGTLVTQAYAKLFPRRVHAAVLQGFAPLEFQSPLFHAVASQRALDLLFYKCQTDRACIAKYPDLRADWLAVLERLSRAPVTVETGSGVLEARRGHFAEAFRSVLTRTSVQRRAPGWIHRAARGDFGPLLDALPRDSRDFALGLFLSIVCSEALPRIRPEEIDRFTAGTFVGRFRVDQDLDACERWPSTIPEESFYEPPPLDAAIPFLVVSGEMDPTTPPEWGARFCRHRPGCRHVVVPDLAHRLFEARTWAGGDCIDRTILGFFQDPANVDTACLATLTPPAFE
jgi:pimeloyl-ACP methyl ester carboxylesterase